MAIFVIVSQLPSMGASSVEIFSPMRELETEFQEP